MASTLSYHLSPIRLGEIAKFGETVENWLSCNAGGCTYDIAYNMVNYTISRGITHTFTLCHSDPSLKNLDHNN